MKMTSRIYGIAVKETVDYYEYDDIKLVFNQDTKQWSVFSNFDNLWMNGVQYHKGDLVVMFADGKVDTYTMMAQYTDTSPYINYMYTITSNFVINPSYYQNGRIEYIFEADPETEPYQFTCKKLLNNVQQNSYTLTDVDIKTYKNQNHGKLPPLFDNMKVDYHGMNPESPYLPYSFTIISNSNYIKDGTTPKQINDIIIQIPAGSGASSYFHRILDETNKHEATPKPGELPSVLMTKKIGKYNAKPSVTFNRETIIRKIYHDHTKVYYNGHYHRAMYLVYDSTGAQGCWKKTIEGLAFTYADPFWLCMTTSAGIELGGQVLEAKRLVRCWKDTDDINLTMRKTKSRKKAAPETAPYDDIIYDVVSNTSNVTVTKYRRKTKIDAQGHKTTEDIQEDLPIVFDTGDSPVRCWNIEFRAKNNVWTIYSKCGYIRYGGRQYPKNRSILDFNAGEEMHIEIKDETEKYEVDEVITYTVTNVMVTKFIYKVWTVGESYTIKVEKSAENVDPEPWVTVNFYDAWNEHPVVIDDIQLDYDIKTNIWTLSSASDELYYYGRKINKGEKIAEWGFNTIISLKDERGINVISANAEKDVKVHIDSTKSQPQGLDISEFYPSNDYYNVDFLLTHSVTKGEWVITSKRDDTYMNGVRYTYNKVIFQGSDKQGYPEFTFMCQHKKDESGPIIPTKNIRYTITISWDPYEQIGNLAVQAVGGESKVYYTREKDPAKNTIVLTKQNAKSMYGYIWKRDMPGPTPVTGYCVFVPITRFYNSWYAIATLVAVNPDPNNWRCTTKHFSTRGWGNWAYVFENESKYVNRLFMGTTDNIVFVDGPNDSVKTVSNSSYNQGNEWSVPDICITGRNSFWKYYKDQTSGSTRATYFTMDFDDNGSTTHMDYGTIDSPLAPDNAYAIGNKILFGSPANDGYPSFNIESKEAFYGTTMDDENSFFDTYDYVHTNEDHQIIEFSQLQEAMSVYNGQIEWQRNQGYNINGRRYFNTSGLTVRCGHILYIYHRLQWTYFSFETGKGRSGDLGTKVVKFDLNSGTASSGFLPMYNEDFIHFWGKSTIAAKYGNKYYLYLSNYENNTLEIYEVGSDGSLTLKESKNANQYVTVPLFNQSGKFADLRVYFKSMECKYVSSGLYECGITYARDCIGDYNGTISDNQFLIAKCKRQGYDNAEVYVCFDNPMLDMGLNNFALDSTYF